MSNLNDDLFTALGALGFSGALNDRMFLDLRNRGFTGVLPDMMGQFGGWQAYFADLLAPITFNFLLEDGFAFLLESGDNFLLESAP